LTASGTSLVKLQMALATLSERPLMVLGTLLAKPRTESETWLGELRIRLGVCLAAGNRSVFDQLMKRRWRRGSLIMGALYGLVVCWAVVLCYVCLLVDGSLLRELVGMA
jgi:hypothetical protein